MRRILEDSSREKLVDRKAVAVAVAVDLFVAETVCLDWSWRLVQLGDLEICSYNAASLCAFPLSTVFV